MRLPHSVMLSARGKPGSLKLRGTKNNRYDSPIVVVKQMGRIEETFCHALVFTYACRGVFIMSATVSRHLA
jgi:hypothetical protein